MCYICGDDAVYVVEFRQSALPGPGEAGRGRYIGSATRRLCARHAKPYMRALEYGKKPPRQEVK